MVPPSAKATSRSPQRSLLAVGVLLLCALALAPVLSLGWFAFDAGEGSRFDLGYGGTEQVLNTLALVALVGLLTAVLGTATGWLTARCAFPGRRWLRIAQLLPLATPSYLLAATWIDLGSRYGLRVHGFTPTLIVMVLSTYSYVFLLSTESFSVSGRRQLEACRSLGVGPWGSFWRVALPMALPAIGAGVALGGMEVVNELGAVQLLGVPTLSTGILNRWQQDGDPQGAVALALMALVIVALLVGAERNLRQRSRCWNLGNDGDADPQWRLVGQRRWLSQALCLLPPLITLGLPVIWAGLSWDQMRAEDTTELLALGSRSFGLALLAAALTVGGGLLLAIAKRWIPNAVLQRLTFISGLGYAIPGTVLALALMLIGGPLALAPLLLLVWGYSDRFLAVSKGGLDAALERIPPSVDEAATSLGNSWLGVLQRVHLPLLRGPLLVGGLLVFVDTVKELPLTFSLRPFDFDTLAVRVYQYASDERVGAALVPALLILALGILAAIALIPNLERLERN
ncbi:MAG: iron ABC transporter permease [Vulcanococcus sp.]|uniref:ABC transporter permease n=1 Tax=Vulcanococcus sp. TaxID=2856995 RepID=UPI0025DFFDEA|nr:iron ABC transporter permease [Vulcanococcus sp.]MBW0168239.1 iron ABC transporter permease [Vulcanococcus sp.]MBW0173754.1 iron ABC transporter permease [Vulcanococcus sp.]